LQIARKNGIGKAVRLSSHDASSTTNMFYFKVKGQLQEEIAGLSFNQYVIFRPGKLLRKDTERLGEKEIPVTPNVFNQLGLFRKYRPLPTLKLTGKLAKAPKVHGAGMFVIKMEEIPGF